MVQAEASSRNKSHTRRTTHPGVTQGAPRGYPGQPLTAHAVTCAAPRRRCSRELQFLTGEESDVMLEVLARKLDDLYLYSHSYLYLYLYLCLYLYLYL